MDKKWNLQDIKPASDRKPKRAPVERTESNERQSKPAAPRRRNTATSSTGKKPRKKTIIIIAICVGILALGFLVNLLLKGAEVRVQPRTREVNINSTFEAHKEPQADQLPYEVLTLEAEGEREVKATGQEQATEQATGEITIYNKTSDSQRLIKNTRFESPNGLVFKTNESVVVPAASDDGTPGSITTSVFATEAGEEYNLDPTEFTVPGFKEGGYDDLYKNIYAKNAVAFTGGFDGMRFILDDSELKAAQDDVHKELQAALKERLPQEKPAGFVYFENGVTFTYQSLPATENGEDSATIHEKALLKVPMFKKSDFAAYIAKASVPGYEGAPVRIDDFSTLDFTYASSTKNVTDIASLDSIDFKLNGKLNLIWDYDTEQLKKDLAGKNRTAIVNILASYPAIENTKIITRPFWKRSLPNNTNDIKIVEDFSLNDTGKEE